MTPNEDLDRFNSLLDTFISNGAVLGDMEIDSVHSLTVPSNWSIANRVQNHSLCTLITGGQGRLDVQGEQRELKSGAFYFIGPGVRHSISTHHDNPISVRSIHFSIRRIGNPSFCIFEHLGARVFQQVNGLMDICAVSSMFPGNPGKSALLKNSLFQALLLFRDFLREAPLRNEDFPTILNSLDQDRNYSIRELADMFGYAEKSFIRKFRQVVGITPHKYLIRHRLTRAKYLLSQSSLPVKEIAESLNYRDQYLFSRQFRKYTGCSPTKYRKDQQTDT